MRPVSVALPALPAILVTDAATGDVVSLDYKKALSLDLRPELSARCASRCPPAPSFPRASRPT